MYKTAAMPAEQSREATLSRYEQALFRRDMSQHCGYLFSRRGRSHEDADIQTHSPECDECGLVARPNEIVIRTKSSLWDILCAHTLWVPASPQAAPHATTDLIAALVTLWGVQQSVCILVAPATSREKVPKLL